MDTNKLIQWKEEIIYLKGEDYFESLIQDIQKAKKYITIEMYLFNNDYLGKKIAKELVKAKRRGVQIEIIVDGVGSYNFFQYLYHLFKRYSIRVKIFNPLPLYHPFLGTLPIISKVIVFFRRLWKINHRNHRKIVTIDYFILYTGSFNFTGEFSNSNQTSWMDTGVKVLGDNVQFAILNFKKNLRLKEYHRYKKSIPSFLYKRWTHQSLRLNQTLKMRRYFYKDFIRKMSLSKKRIWLMTPYFIPRKKIIKEMVSAAKHGIDVRILISKYSDVKFFKWLRYFYYEFLIQNNVKVYEYDHKVIHSKNFIIDDFVTVGSTNLNHRSFIHDLEVDLVLQNSVSKTIITENFLSYTKEEHRITIDHLKKRPLWDILFCRVLFMFRYWF